MIEIRETEAFRKWIRSLRDSVAKAKIASRIQRLKFGNPGDVKPVGEGVSEMRIDHGPGYRVYYVNRGNTIIVILCGGDKSTQQADISRALGLAKEL
ncbi:type II toxin-antitoxin system RelE/ParE family toxin [Microvirga sp. 3-52]|nr:type II toxin-antitoxin system RelE/ParE family toxin [Microvirga sp. 3-52]